MQRALRGVAIDGAVLLSAPHMSFSDEFASVVSRGLNFEPCYVGGGVSRHAKLPR